MAFAGNTEQQERTRITPEIIVCEVVYVCVCEFTYKSYLCGST